MTAALKRMTDTGYFHRDVLAAGKSVSPTFVQRVLVGDRGMTYHYPKLRIRAPLGRHAPHAASPSASSARSTRPSSIAPRRTSAPTRDPRVGGADFLGPHRYNVTLVNLEPAERCRCGDAL